MIKPLAAAFRAARFRLTAQEKRFLSARRLCNP